MFSRIILALFIFALPTVAQDSFQTFDGSTSGTAISNATIALGTNGTGTGTWGGCTNTGSDFFHSQAFQMPFPGLQAAAGTKFPGGGTTGLQYTLRSVQPYPLCDYGGFTSTTSMAVAFTFNANFDSTGNSSQQESNLQIINGGGTDYMILRHFNGLLQLETHNSTPANFTTAGVTFHGNSPVFVSMFYKVGSAYTMSVYNSACQLIGSQQVSTISPNNNPGLVIVGITGAESEPSGGGNAIGWDNVIVKEGASGEIQCGDSSWLSNGVLAPYRAYDWTTAGVTGGIPSATWTQCGSTIAPYTGTATTISNALAGNPTPCSANQYVLLGNGTFNLSSGITFPSTGSNVALRGGGANSTFLVYTSGASGSHKISISGPASYTSAVQWTNGYAQGAKQIKLASIPSGVVVGSLIRLSQCDDGTTGFPSCAGTSTDNGQLFNCSTQYSSPNGCSVNGPSATQNFLWQQEKSIVAGISGTTITLQDPIAAPNWNPGQSPRADFITAPISYVGVENLSIDSSGLGTVAGWDIDMSGCVNCWVTGVRTVNSQQFAISPHDTVDHGTIMSNYFAFSQANTSGAASTHAIANSNVAHMLEVNNIAQGFSESVHNEQAISSSVIAYNFVVNMLDNTDLMDDGIRFHGDAGTFNLFEGNVTNRIWLDVNHGVNRVNTLYRNFITGWESCANGNCGGLTKDSQTNAIQIDPFDRYMNLSSNIFGTPTFHNVYKSTTSAANKIAVALGVASGVAPNDSLVGSSGMLWGNYDVVTAAVRWCGNSSDTGWSTTCSSTSEVPTGALLYANPVPTKGDTGGTLPASFVFSSKPTFFQANPWPAIGSDISGGNVIQCGGSLNTGGNYNGLPALATGATCPIGGTGWAGLVNANPPMKCFLSVMGGVPDGTGSPLPFNASACYASGGITATPTFSPVAGTYRSPLPVTITSATTGATLCVTIDGTTPTANGAGTCTHGSTLTNGGTITVSFTQLVQAIASESGLTDSAVGSALYTLPTASIGTMVAGIAILEGLVQLP